MQVSDSQKWLALAGLLAGGWVLYLLAPVLTPFLVAALLAYLGDPLVDRLERRKLSRTVSVILVFSLIFLVLVLALVFLLPLLQSQIAHFVERLPGYLSWIQNNVVPALNQALGQEELFDLQVLRQALSEHWQQAGSVAAGIAGSLFGSGMKLLGWLANLVLIPVVTFYLLRDWDLLVEEVRSLLPRSIEPTVSQLARESDEVLGAFLRGQLMVMLALGSIYSIGLWLAGLEVALLVGMLAGLVSFVPYLGFIVGFLAAGLAMLLQTQEWLPLLPVLAVFGVGQLVESLLLTPLLVGDRIGLHPVAVIFAVLAGGQLFGFFGVLLALPVAAVLAVLVRHAHQRYLQSGLYGARRETPDS